LPKSPLLFGFSFGGRSLKPAVSESLQAFLLPLFFPLLTSLLLAQQQHSPIWIRNAKMAQPLAIHIKTNISMPRLAPMLSWVTEPKAFLMMMNMTVASTVATVTHSAARKVKMAMTKAAQRETTDKGVMKIMTKVRQAPERKRPNIQCDTVSMRLRMLVMSEGRATVWCQQWLLFSP